MKIASLVAGTLLVGCGPVTMAPPPCSGDPCSLGTPRYNPPNSLPDGAVLDSGARRDGAADALDLEAGNTWTARGTVSEARALPRARPDDTAPLSNWSVQSLLDPALGAAMTDARGAFTALAMTDREGVAPFVARLALPSQCAVGHGRVGVDGLTIIAASAARIADELAPTGITVDPSLAHLVVEVEDAARRRVSGVTVQRAPGDPTVTAYDVDGSFGVVDGTGSFGTAIIPNLDAPVEGAKVELVLTRQGRARRSPIYLARGCTTFVTALAP